MKTAAFALAAFLFAITLRADPPAAIDTFAGLPFGATQDQVRTAMNEHGAEIRPGMDSPDHQSYIGGTFNNQDVNWWHFYFKDGKLYKSVAVFTAPDGQNLAKYNDIVDMVTKKYGPPFQQTKLDMAPDDLDGLIANGKAALETDWRGANPGSRSISCKLIESVFPGAIVIRLAYQDDSIVSQVAASEGNDL
jgi:hypothetical protein